MKGGVMVDVRKTFESAGEHARHAQRNGTRLVFSGIGFSAAYFLDPEHGPARRRQAVVLMRRARAVIASARSGHDAPVPGQTGAFVPGSRAAEAPVPAENLRIAR
jgi:hypothetical protein